MTKAEAKKIVAKYNPVPFKNLSRDQKDIVLAALDVITVQK